MAVVDQKVDVESAGSHHVFTRTGKGLGEEPKPKCVFPSWLSMTLAKIKDKKGWGAAESQGKLHGFAPDLKPCMCEKHSQNGLSTPGRTHSYGLELKKHFHIL